jgi:hypothetical protein
VQVDPIDLKLNAHGTKRLKLKCDEPLSDFAFNFNLRRYTAVPGDRRHRALQCGKPVLVEPMKPVLKLPGIKRLTLECDELVSKFAFNFNLRHYNVGKSSLINMMTKRKEVAKTSKNPGRDQSQTR